jgi:hypothetical protein
VYEITTDRTHNILEFRLNGMVPLDEMEQFVREMHEAGLSLQGRPIKIKADVRRFKPAAPEIAEMIRDLEELWLLLGVTQIAEIVENNVVALQLQRVARESGATKVVRRFEDEKSAHEWLLESGPSAPKKESDPASLQGIEVRGGAVDVILSGFSAFPSLANKYLARCGFTVEVTGGRVTVSKPWVSLHLWLKTFDIMLKDIGPNALFQLGLAITRNPNMLVGGDLRSTIGRMDIAYHMSHRKNGELMYDASTGRMLEGIGHYVMSEGEQSSCLLVHSDTPYPCQGELGMLTSLAMAIDPRARVRHEDVACCRLKDRGRCTYSVSW